MPDVLFTRIPDWLQRRVDRDEVQRGEVTTGCFGDAINCARMLFTKADGDRAPFQIKADRFHGSEDCRNILFTNQEIDVDRSPYVPMKRHGESTTDSVCDLAFIQNSDNFAKVGN